MHYFGENETYTRSLNTCIIYEHVLEYCLNEEVQRKKYSEII